MTTYYVGVPVADLRQGENLPQESQLLLGEKVLAFQEKEGWVYVEAVEQPKKEGACWRSYPGWMEKRALTLSPPLQKKAFPAIADKRAFLIEKGKTFLDVPYLWGGRSIAGVDCSGLVHLLYGAIGVALPRDAHDQSLVSYPCKRQELLKGDLIFTLPKDKPRIDHAMLYAGESLLLEATSSVGCVRLIAMEERLNALFASGYTFRYGRIITHSNDV